MTTRFLIAAALMASACAAHADVLPGTAPAATVISGSNVAGTLGDASMIAGVSRGAGSDALVQALYDKVSAAVGSDMKVSLKQGIDGVYVQGLSTAKAAALAGNGMSVINTSEGFKVIQAQGASGAGAAQGTPSGSNGANNANTGTNNGNLGNSGNGVGAGNTGLTGNAGITGSGTGTDIGVGVGVGSGTGTGTGTGAGTGTGTGSGNLGNQAGDTANVPEPSTVFLMLAGMLGAVGLRRRAR